MLISKRIACVYGEDGLDPDVLLNQIDFFKKHGFRVVFGSKIIKCDLLIITRVSGNDFQEGINSLLISQIRMILFLDYSGQNCHSVFNGINHKNKYLITSRDNFVGKDIYFGHPYVSIPRWKIENTNYMNRVYNCVHIGNYKFFSNFDKFINNFNEIVSRNSVHVFGDFWPEFGTNPLFHGKLKLKEVSKIYRQSRFAIGIKHPFQRGVAISGRYWHATLNGCALFVEDDYLINEIPGLHFYNCTSNLNLTNTLNRTVHDSDKLAYSAFSYWTESNKLQISLLEFVDEVTVKYSFKERLQLIRLLVLNYIELNLYWLFRLLKGLKLNFV